MTSPRTQAEALVVLTWNQESVILSDSVKKREIDKSTCSFLQVLLSIFSIALFFFTKLCIAVIAILYPKEYYHRT